MKKHEKEVLQSQLDAEKAVLKQLEQNYQQAIKDIDEKVAALLGRADADMQHVIYQVEYQRQLRTQVQSILEQLQANEFETIAEYLTQCYEDGFISALYSLQQQGVPLMLPIDQKKVVKAVQTNSKISESLYTRLGKDIDELRENIASEIARGISTSAPYSQIAKNIDRQAQIELNRAMRITRTEGGRINNVAAMDTMIAAKEMGADVVKRWSAALDARTRDSHMMLDGEVKEIDEPFSNGLMHPGDPAGDASEVVNCRCKVQEVARWALSAIQTKMLGDVSQMSDSQKEAIASKLGVPAENLGEYSGKIVPISAESYDDFKQQYNDIWRYEGSDLQKEAEARIASYKKMPTKTEQKATKTDDSNKKAQQTAQAKSAETTKAPATKASATKPVAKTATQTVPKPSAKAVTKAAATPSVTQHQYTASELDNMSLAKLRKTAEKLAVEYYSSGLSGISFGGASIESAAKNLAAAGSKTSLKKDIRAMQKKLLAAKKN